MRKVPIAVLYFVSFVVIAQPQHSIENEKSFQIGFSGGIRYDSKKTYKELGQGNACAVTIEVVKDFWKTQKHFLGFDLIGYYSHPQNNSSDSSKFLYYLNFIYKRKNRIYNSMTFELDLGLSLYNNTVDKSILSPIINAKLTYQLCCFEIFIKNSFRWDSFFWKAKPWLFTVGVSIQI